MLWTLSGQEHTTTSKCSKTVKVLWVCGISIVFVYAEIMYRCVWVEEYHLSCRRRLVCEIRQLSGIVATRWNGQGLDGALGRTDRSALMVNIPFTYFDNLLETSHAVMWECISCWVYTLQCAKASCTHTLTHLCSYQVKNCCCCCWCLFLLVVTFLAYAVFCLRYEQCGHLARRAESSKQDFQENKHLFDHLTYAAMTTRIQPSASSNY